MIKNCSFVSIERERSWVIDLEKKLTCNNAANLRDEEIQWKKPSIFKLPEFVKMIKPGVFTPKVVALGPYHHHKSDLQPLESHKERALHNFLKRGVKSLGVYVRVMMGVVEELQCSYVDLQEEWKNQDNFIKLMITDGCFMLEVMRLDVNHCKHYAPSDPFFGPHAMKHKVPYMRRDMLMLENQLPILVFKKLVSIEMDVDEAEAECIITELVVKFFVPRIYNNKDDLAEFTRSIHGFHALDIYRRSQLFISSKTPQFSIIKPYVTNFAVMRSAARQREAGIKFKRSPSSALTTISFDSRHGILTLPEVTVDDSTEYVFLNMVALEHVHAESGSDISSYVAFMGALVDSAEDVQLLHRHGMVKNGLGSDEDFANLFSRMSQEVIVDHGGSLGFVQWEVEKYCQRWWNKCCAYLQHTYFRNPWTSISVFAAAFAIFLTLVSTVVSFLQWKKV
ncbi:hypothetical protein IEQ34_016426 [Dendrobium chrysotoxum]|uniref:Uncharacterized protein n=1 Tax=Dendrobium chrysotoxum TaxID=161865 RepID=A0AAV7GG23_DENCH|nr:hypothetical protein IEQ34_016426 [Dendrobium chrysotoxum]